MKVYSILLIQKPLPSHINSHLGKKRNSRRSINSYSLLQQTTAQKACFGTPACYSEPELMLWYTHSDNYYHYRSRHVSAIFFCLTRTLKRNYYTSISRPALSRCRCDMWIISLSFVFILLLESCGYFFSNCTWTLWNGSWALEISELSTCISASDQSKDVERKFQLNFAATINRFYEMKLET